jgi:leucyl aminopeptidase
MTQIILQIKSDSLAVATASSSSGLLSSTWFWIAIVELFIIIFLLVRLKKKKTELAFSDLPKDKMKNAKSSLIDMDNLMNSINGSRDLYKELSKACHPDKFVNTEKQKIAEDIFQEISKDKRNFEKLLAHKERAKNELNINF